MISSLRVLIALERNVPTLVVHKLTTDKFRTVWAGEKLFDILDVRMA